MTSAEIVHRQSGTSTPAVQNGALLQSSEPLSVGYGSPLPHSTQNDTLDALGLEQRALLSLDPPSIWERVSSNPIFSAGFGLMGLGAGVALIRRGLIVSDTLLRRRIFVTLEIPSTDRAHPWVLQWLSKQRAAEDASINKHPREMHQLSLSTSYTRHDNGAGEVAFEQVPGEGLHWVKYRGAWLQIKRERNGRMVDIKSGTPWETIQITTLSRDRELFTDMLNEAYSLGTQGVENKTVVYTAWNVEWRPLGPPRRKRDLNSVVLAEGLKESLLEDVRLFLDRSQWYAVRGIPYRRGYLLSGPPGSGKSSFVQALAGELSMDICILNLSERGLTDDKLNHLLINAPPRSIFLLEDIDAAFNKRAQTSSDGYQSSVTFSGLLNALDGVGAAEERIVFMTSNHAERLDPALIRPGRVDRHEIFGDASPKQAEELFRRFYLGTKRVTELSHQLAVRVKLETQAGKSLSMAALQGHFIQHSGQEALAAVDKLWAVTAAVSSPSELDVRPELRSEPGQSSASPIHVQPPSSETERMRERNTKKEAQSKGVITRDPQKPVQSLGQEVSSVGNPSKADTVSKDVLEKAAETAFIEDNWSAALTEMQGYSAIGAVPSTTLDESLGVSAPCGGTSCRRVSSQESAQSPELNSIVAATVIPFGDLPNVPDMGESGGVLRSDSGDLASGETTALPENTTHMMELSLKTALLGTSSLSRLSEELGSFVDQHLKVFGAISPSMLGDFSLLPPPTQLVSAGQLVSLEKGSLRMPCDEVWLIMPILMRSTLRWKLRAAGFDTVVQDSLQAATREASEFLSQLKKVSHLRFRPFGSPNLYVRPGDVISFPEGSMRVPSVLACCAMELVHFRDAVLRLRNMRVSVVAPEMLVVLDLRKQMRKRRNRFLRRARESVNSTQIPAEHLSSEVSSMNEEQASALDGA